ncbi:inosine-uridine preferring nucleoside hydrolase-like [Oppia nitens]|uniref:inosine-uridine preferring nucleoside hydrolase-like n=1 Tax=Oppia nitens TaxID=1686743 RepID=UPI0023DB885B|nr:inosine-uridine preferring nucleoside hydrolase-like [Oppia nitens]
MSKKLVIIDTDCGLDDSLAILLATYCHQQNMIDILAITCTHGNTSCQNVVKNVGLTLRASGLLEGIKIYKGCDGPIIGKYLPADHCGADGLGDATKDMPPIVVQLEKEHAVNALVRLANEYRKQITLIALGPLTNIGLAYLMDNQFYDNLKGIVFLGGTVDFRALTNMSPTQEYNIICDPEACHIMLTNANNCPITIVPVECSMDTLITWEMYEKIINIGSEKSNFIKTIYKMDYNRDKSDPIYKGIISPDILAIIAFVYKDLVIDKQSYRTTIELNGQLSRGQLVLDKRSGFRFESPDWPLVTFIKQIDNDKFDQLLLKFIA